MKLLVVIAMVLLGALFVVACADLTEEQKQQETEKRVERNNGKTRLLAIVDGCRIWEVYNEDGTNPFFARCPEGAVDTFESHKGGYKNRDTIKNFTLGGQ